MANPLEIAASKALVPVIAVAGLVGLYLIYREVTKSPEEREDDRAEAEADAIERARDRTAASADAAYDRNAGTNFVDYLTTALTFGLYVPDRIVGGTPVQVSGKVVLPGGAVITLQQISDAGGIRFEPATERTVFTWRGTKYAFSGQNDSEGRRVAVKA